MKRLLVFAIFCLVLLPRQTLAAEADVFCASGPQGPGVWQPCGTGNIPLVVGPPPGTAFPAIIQTAAGTAIGVSTTPLVTVIGAPIRICPANPISKKVPPLC